MQIIATIDCRRNGENPKARVGINPMNAKACLKSGRVFWALLAGLTAATVPKVRGGSVSTDFNSGSAPGYLLGGAYLDSVGGVDGSGCLKLTTSFYNGQMGSFILDDLDGGAPITGFRASFRMLIGGGSGADGLSLNFANDYTWSEFGEEGDGTGLTISFDTYNNGGGEAPAIDVKKGGNIIYSRKGNLALFRTGDYGDVVVQVDPEGTLD